MERAKINVPAFIIPKGKSAPNLKPPTEVKTKDICAGGAFVITKTLLQVATDVDVVVHFAFSPRNEEYELQSSIPMSGTIIRIESAGMAAKFDEKFQFPNAPSTSRNLTHLRKA